MALKLSSIASRDNDLLEFGLRHQGNGGGQLWGRHDMTLDAARVQVVNRIEVLSEDPRLLNELFLVIILYVAECSRTASDIAFVLVKMLHFDG